MTECGFCGDEFDSDEELHRHWEEHEEELNSHQKDEMKKAKKSKKEREQKKMQKRKKYGGYGLAAVLGLAFVGVVASQVAPMFAGGNGSGSAELDLEGEPRIGNESAEVTVVEFGDYRCPYCSRFHSQVYPQLEQNYIDTGQVKFYFVNYAFLDSGFPGRTSERAAVAGECVLEQDREQFWNFHDSLYENQGRENTDWATESFLLSTFNSSAQGLDYGEFRTCLQNEETSDEVEQDRQMAQSAGVSSTPTVFVNGEQVSQWNYPSLSRTIERELREN